MNALLVARVVWMEFVRRKDFYVLGILLAATVAFLLSMDTFGVAGATRHVLDGGLTLSWIGSLILTLSAAARQLPMEEQRGTIYTVLSKPLSRASLLMGKWLGAWAAGAVATALFYAVTIAAAAGRGGGVDARTLVQAFTLHTVALAMAAAVALALSTRLSLGAALTVAWIIVLESWFFAARIPELAGERGGFQGSLMMFWYLATPQWALFDLRVRLTHGWGPAPGGAVGGVMLYGVGWTALFLILAWLAYHRRRFQRSDA